MEEFLSKSLSFLPVVNTCCFCVKNMKVGAAISAVVIFLTFSLSMPIWPVFVTEYHHQKAAMPIVHSIIFYIFFLLAIMVFILNIIVFVTLCIDMRKVWGLLFVLVFLVAIAFYVIWTLFALIRYFVAPGLISSQAYNNTKCPRVKDKKKMRGMLCTVFIAILLTFRLQPGNVV